MDISASTLPLRKLLTLTSCLSNQQPSSPPESQKQYNFLVCYKNKISSLHLWCCKSIGTISAKGAGIIQYITAGFYDVCTLLCAIHDCLGFSCLVSSHFAVLPKNWKANFILFFIDSGAQIAIPTSCDTSSFHCAWSRSHKRPLPLFPLFTW